MQKFDINISIYHEKSGIVPFLTSNEQLKKTYISLK